jgi:hypothetical protein
MSLDREQECSTVPAAVMVAGKEGDGLPFFPLSF